MSDDKKQTWRPPTRRMFVAMLGAAAAALAVRETQQLPADAPRQRIPRWIGHC